MVAKLRLIAFVLFVLTGTAFASVPSGTVTINLTPTVDTPGSNVKLWVPYPMSDEFQTISEIQVNGNYSKSGIYRDPKSEAVYFSAEWITSSAQPFAVMSFHVSQKNRKNTNLNDSASAFPVLVQPYLEATKWIPSDDPEMKAIAKKATQGKKGTLEKARGVYDWVVENTFRDPTVQGCGLGLPERTLKQCKGGGKCADLSTVFVTIARAAGIPARDVYGLRLSSPKEGDITSAYHCWAEFYLPGTGWVMVDPADVRKMMLVHKLELKDADYWRTFFWGGDNLFRVVLETNSRGVVLNGNDTPLNYFMYPAAKINNTMLNHFDATSFGYNVVFKAD